MPILFLQHMKRGLVAIDDGLRSQTQLQRVIEAMQMPLDRNDHPVAQCATLTGNTARAKACARR